MQHSQDMVDHLFRHHYGRMVAILCKLFGTAHLQTIEDAVQDSFAKAISSWRKGLPDNPEAWLTQVAKNRAIDIIRQLKAEDERIQRMEQGSSSISINKMFMEEEIADAQLRMIFTACHPSLDPRDQISFALKTIAGLSHSEISAALLLKEETVKKRLGRARKKISEEEIAFKIPEAEEIEARLARVLEVIYLIFNEGFHSSQKEQLVRRELCTEALRLCTLLSEHERTASPSVHALIGLMYFHAARLDSKLGLKGDIIDLEHQDRSLWNQHLALAGHEAMEAAMDCDVLSVYHYEAAIAAEHLKSPTFAQTDWSRIEQYYISLQLIAPSDINLLNLSLIMLQLGDQSRAASYLSQVHPDGLEQRRYLYHGCMSRYHEAEDELAKALSELDKALEFVNNHLERDYLLLRKERIIQRF